MHIPFHKTILFTALFLGLSSTAISASNPDDHKVFLPKDIKWADAPSSLPKGAKIAVLEGDPSKAGSFTMRLKFPANYRIPPHFHPIIERLTVLSGTFYLGMGDNFDQKQAHALPRGSFAYMQPEIHHFAFTRDEAIVQLNGDGPWGISYINSQDDPRSKH